MQGRKEKLLYSVIIPIYNSDKYLRACLNSILQQVFKEYEIILVDDGSVDDSGNICDEYARKYSNISVYHQKNAGPSAARNLGMKHAKGKYWLFVDSDDYLEGNDLFCNASEIIQNYDPDVIVFGFKKYFEYNNSYKIEKPLKVIRKPVSYSIIENDNQFVLSASGKFIKSTLFRENNLLFEDNRYNEDMDWCARLIIAARNFSVLDQNAYVYRQRSKSRSKVIGEKHLKDIEQNIEQCFQYNIDDRSETFKAAYKKYLARAVSMYVICCAIGFYKGEYNEPFIKKYYDILKWESRKRERIIYFTIRYFGVKITLILLHIVARKKRLV